jgi:pimeloyl-ACP methyl ester carboxylesterase
MTDRQNSPNTIVLIHGLWVTPLSWEHRIERYSAKGYQVLAPAWPRMDRPIEELRTNPDLVAELGIEEIVDHYAEIIGALDAPPIIMGHSFGGTLTQLLLDRGCGAVGVAIDSAPTEGVRVSPLSQIKSLFPALKDPRNRHKAFGFTPEEFHYAFTNTLSDEESRKVYDRYYIPAPGNWIWAYGLIANFKPGHQETWVNYKNPNRAPLLFVGGSEDHIMPPSVNKSNAKHYKGDTITEYHEFEGRDHWTCGAEGWEAVADFALEWALAHASGADAPMAAAPA